MNKLTTINTTN